MTENNMASHANVSRKVMMEVKRADDFKQIYSIGALGGHSPYDFRIGFYNDSIKGVDKDTNAQIVERIVEGEIIMSPLAAVELFQWLEQHINDFEAMFGPITKVKKQSQKEVTSEIQGYM